MRFVRINEHARMPVYGSAEAAGADLHAAENTVVPAKGRVSLTIILFSLFPFFRAP